MPPRPTVSYQSFLQCGLYCSSERGSCIHTTPTTTTTNLGHVWWHTAGIGSVDSFVTCLRSIVRRPSSFRVIKRIEQRAISHEGSIWSARRNTPWGYSRLQWIEAAKVADSLVSHKLGPQLNEEKSTFLRVGCGNGAFYLLKSPTGDSRTFYPCPNTLIILGLNKSRRWFRWLC